MEIGGDYSRLLRNRSSGRISWACACTGSGACPRTIWTARSCAWKPWAL